MSHESAPGWSRYVILVVAVVASGCSGGARGVGNGAGGSAGKTGGGTGGSVGGGVAGSGGKSGGGAGGVGSGDAGGGAGSVGSGVGGSAGKTGSGGSGGSGAGGSSGAGGQAPIPGDPPFTSALPIPSVLAPTSSDATADHYSITIEPGTAQMKPGALTPIVGFNGIFPGPTIVATRGRTVQVTQTNRWTENVTIHNHGHKVAAASDGHPTDYIAPGASKVYTYPNDQGAATYFYHDHTMDLTGPHVYGGLAGLYLIKDPAEDHLNLPAGVYDIPLLIQDKSFKPDNSLAYAPNAFVGMVGDTAVVNGVATPYLDVDTRKYRFRLLNGANSRPFAVKLQVTGSSTAEPFQVIASDGGLLAAPVQVTSLPLAPAERYDIVVDFSKYPVGTKLTLVNTDPVATFPADGGFGGGPFGDGGGGAVPIPSLTNVMQFVVARAAPDPSSVPAALTTVARHQEGEAVATKQIVFRFSGADWTLNGLTYDPARADETSRLGQVYIWTLSNQSGIGHPFHKHLSQFNVLDVDGQPPAAYARGWKDTVQVPANGTVRVIFSDENFTGTYVFHCHNLEHEDHRMMLQEQVGP